MAHITVIKRSGEHVAFDEGKVIHSMQRVGVPENLHQEVLDHIKARIQKDNSITTDEIFYHIREFLNEKDKKSSIRFNLRQAIFELGPTGFPFEQYLARIFKSQGYGTETDVVLQGECVSHEIDVLLTRDNKKEIVEAKFHNQKATKTDVQVMLYMWARFLDVKDMNKIDGVWVATNTKLTKEAVDYSRCKGIKALAWNYPEENNLQDFVEKPAMYPITILSELTDEEKKRLINNDIVLVSKFLELPNDELEDKYLIDKKRIEEAKTSARLICNPSR